MISYTVIEKDGAAKSYECGMCGVSSADLDAARAHHAVHVAGPDMLRAHKAIRARIEGEWDQPDLVSMGDLNGVPANDFMKWTEAAIAKAEPKG